MHQTLYPEQLLYLRVVLYLKKAKVSHNVITRLPRYLRYLTDLKDGGVERTSSGELGQLMGITASQIRQDFSCFGEFGQQGYGYNVEMLTKAIMDILGVNTGRSAIIIGIGNMGRVLIANFPFSLFGFKLTAAFDNDREKIENPVNGIDTYDISELEKYVRENEVDIAVLTMPGGAANEVATVLIRAGIKGLWNFTNVDLKHKSDKIVVENIHFSDSLMILNYYLSRHLDEQKSSQ